MKPAKQRQQGFALLTVLMIVALVAMIGSQLLYEQHSHIKRSSYMLHQAQSFSVNWGIESWVRAGLEEDRKRNKTDHLEEVWAKPLGPIPYENGEITGQLFDLQGRLNLNNISDLDSESDSEIRKIWQAIIQRYVEQNNLPESFVDVLTDWIDKDDEVRPNGAESNNYLLQEPAYSAANQSLVMLSELKRLQGLDILKPKQWQIMQQDLSTLPQEVMVNVNTAGVRVLMALTDWITEEMAQKWVAVRVKNPAKTTDNFRAFMMKETAFTQEEVLGDLPNWVITTSSKYFLLKAQLNFGESKQVMSAIFSRQTNKKVQLVQRWLSVTETH